MINVTVREYARLTTASVAPTLDQCTITESAFKHLCEISAQFTNSGASLVQLEDRLSLRLDNYVGIIETPCGTSLEILPKHIDHYGEVDKARSLLRKMLECALDLPTREGGAANIELFRSPLSEWVMRQFLQSVDHIVKRGVRFDYVRIDEERRFLRGQLAVARQMRQPPGRQQLFHIRHDEFSPNRPENRLIRSAIDRVRESTQDPGNWRLARELATILSEIPPSLEVKGDFREWNDDRLMAHYRPVKPWCKIILGEHMPLALRGKFFGISLLFPMEKLFERYVEDSLRKTLLPGAILQSQVGSKFLCTHEGKPFFQMRPDLKLAWGGKAWILDAKWKRLQGELIGSGSPNDKANYGLSQADFYQLFAYGHKYLGGKGDLILIYPKTAQLAKALPAFEFSEHMRIWVVPFDLAKRELEPLGTFLPLTTIHGSSPIEYLAVA